MLLLFNKIFFLKISSTSSWSNWSEASDCDSSCLYGPSKRLGEGSTGLLTYSRNCLDYKRRCLGPDRKYQTCVAKQCYSVPIITIPDFARQVCQRAQKFDMELTGNGEQIVGNIEQSCKIYCKTKQNTTKSRSWTFPDGTACRSIYYGIEDPSYCIQGRCEKFSCENVTGNYHKIDAIFCKKDQIVLSTTTATTTTTTSTTTTTTTTELTIHSLNNIKYSNNYNNYITTKISNPNQDHYDPVRQESNYKHKFYNKHYNYKDNRLVNSVDNTSGYNPSKHHNHNHNKYENGKF